MNNYRIEDLKDIHDFKLNSLEEFTNVVVKAVEKTCHWKKFGQWLHEEYYDHSKEGLTNFVAVIIVMNDCYNKETPQFHPEPFKNISSVTVYKIFYTDITGGGFVINEISLHYNAISSFKKLLL